MYDESFKKMAEELSEMKESLRMASLELNIDPERISNGSKSIGLAG
jgi:hypothetical protein